MFGFLGGGKKNTLIRELLEQRMRREGFDELEYRLEVKRLSTIKLMGTPEALIVTVIETVIKNQKKGKLLSQILNSIEERRKRVGHNRQQFNEILAVANGPNTGASVNMYCSYRISIEHASLLTPEMVEEVIQLAMPEIVKWSDPIEESAQEKPQSGSHQDYTEVDLAEWETVIEVYPEVERHRINLDIFSPQLSEEYQATLIKNKSFKRGAKIAKELKLNFLKTNYGDNRMIHGFVEQEILQGRPENALEIKEKVKLLGSLGNDKASELISSIQKETREEYEREISQESQTKTYRSEPIEQNEAPNKIYESQDVDTLLEEARDEFCQHWLTGVEGVGEKTAAKIYKKVLNHEELTEREAETIEISEVFEDEIEGDDWNSCFWRYRLITYGRHAVTEEEAYEIYRKMDNDDDVMIMSNHLTEREEEIWRNAAILPGSPNPELYKFRQSLYQNEPPNRIYGSQEANKLINEARDDFCRFWLSCFEGVGEKNAEKIYKKILNDEELTEREAEIVEWSEILENKIDGKDWNVAFWVNRLYVDGGADSEEDAYEIYRKLDNGEEETLTEREEEIWRNAAILPGSPNPELYTLRPIGDD